jgi:uncharacterized protein
MIHCYKLCGNNIVLDIASGSIHSVDDVAFDAISIYEKESEDEVISRIMEKHPEITKDEVFELISDIEQLKSRGKLFSADTFAPAAKTVRRAPLKALCMNVSHLCNMTCAYCFAGRGEYGGSGELMSFETGRRAIDFLMEKSESQKNLDVDFFGGEPLLNWGVVKDLVNYARKIEQGSGKRFRFTLTTNGLLVDDDVIDFANREMHTVVLSLDGRPHVNDALRKLPDGGGSYSDVVPKFKNFVEARRGKGYYIRGTFTRCNLDFSNDILHIADLGFSELSMEPAVSKPGEPHALTMSDLQDISRQYEILAVEMLRRKRQGRGFTFYHYLLDLTKGPCVHKRISGCGVGTEYLAVAPDGKLYPCHQFVGDVRFLMGDVWRGVVNNKQRDEFSNCDIYSRAECRDCWARMYCSGGCAANGYYASGSVSGVYVLGCEMFKKRIECAIMLEVASAQGLGYRG